MKFKIRYADQIVGIFSIAAIAGLVILIFAIGSQQHWFEKKNTYFTVFESGSGVSVGMDLTYKGFSIGKIKKVSLDGVMVRVDYYVLGEYTSYVKENSLVQLVTSPIGLGSSFNFYPGKGPDLLPSESEIFRVDSRHGQKMIENHLIHIEKTTDSIGAIMNQVTDLLNHINSLAGQLDSALAGRIRGKATPIQSIVGQIDGMLKNINELLSDESGVIPKVLGPELSGDLITTLDNVAQISGDFTGVAANADKLVANAVPQVDSALIQLNTVLIQVEDVLTGLKNNPLLKGGIPDRSQSSSATTQMRNSDF